MDNNPYDTSLEWTHLHNQSTEDVPRYEGAYLYPLTPSYQQEKIRPPAPSKRLSKREALEMARALKGYIGVATLLGFGTLGALVASQVFTTNTTMNWLQAGPGMQAHFGHGHFRHGFYPSGPSNSGGFFNQQGPGQGGGYGFGQGNTSSPFSGSHTS